VRTVPIVLAGWSGSFKTIGDPMIAKYLDAVRRHVASRNGRNVLLTIGAVTVLHFVHRLYLLPPFWREVKKLADSPRYVLLVREPWIEAVDFLVRPVLPWISIAVVFCLIAPVFEKRDTSHRASLMPPRRPCARPVLQHLPLVTAPSGATRLGCRARTQGHQYGGMPVPGVLHCRVRETGRAGRPSWTLHSEWSTQVIRAIRSTLGRFPVASKITESACRSAPRGLTDCDFYRCVRTYNELFSRGYGGERRGLFQHTMRGHEQQQLCSQASLDVRRADVVLSRRSGFR